MTTVPAALACSGADVVFVMSTFRMLPKMIDSMTQVSVLLVCMLLVRTPHSEWLPQLVIWLQLWLVFKL